MYHPFIERGFYYVLETNRNSKTVFRRSLKKKLKFKWICGIFEVNRKY